ncbi:MAG: FlgD immunoglobulin-like domain containing protein [Candidatus Kryptoniota bacterium]
MRYVVILLLAIAVSASAQTPKVVSTKAAPEGAGSQVWEIPFASTGNTISLNVQNNSSLEAKNVSVTFNHLPTWLNFKSNSASLKDVSPNSTGDAEFTFSVDKKASVGKDTTLTATISTSDGQTWTKDITVEVAAPKDYQLYNNFPNPFNPSTKIAFDLPEASHVKLVIYDIVGREVAQVADADYPAGYTELTWNGINKNGVTVSSGVYLCRISTDKWSSVKKMMMLK